MISFRNIHLAFDEVLIESGDLEIKDGLVTVLVGSSGSGKTSLLHELGLLTDNLSGMYTFEKRLINDFSYDERRGLLKNEITLVFQDVHLFNTMTIAQNIFYAAKFAGRTMAQEDMHQYMDYVDLGLDLNTIVADMSGGERQRLAIICGMVKDAKVFLFDEPTAYLDKENKEKIVDIVCRLAHEMHKMVLIASHDAILIEVGDAVYCIEEKQVSCTKQPTAVSICDKEKSQSKAPIDKPTLKHFVKDSVSTKKLRWLLSIIISIVLSGFVLFFVFSTSYQQTTGNTLLESMNRQLLIEKTDEKEYTRTDKIDLQVALTDYKVYSLVELQGQCLQDSQVQEVTIMPYFSNTFTKGNIYKEIDKQKNIYCSYELYRMLQQEDSLLQVFDTTSPIAFAGVAKPSVTNSKTVFLPYAQYLALYQNAGLDIMDYPVKQMVIPINEVLDIKAVQDILPSKYMVMGLEDYQLGIALMALFSSTTVLFTWLIGFVALLVYQMYSMLNQKKDFALLEVYGLHFKQLVYMNAYKDGCWLIKVMLFSIGIVCAITVLTQTFTLSLLYQTILLVGIHGMVIFLLEIVAFIVLLKKISPSQLLR